MDLKEVRTCPLGSTCVEVKNGEIHRCMWHVKLVGIDAQGKEHDEYNCAIAWNPILQLEVSSKTKSQTSAVESLRNIINDNQKKAIEKIDQLGKNHE